MITENVCRDRWALRLGLPLAALVAIASLGGLLLSSTYALENRLHAVQALGNDAGNLVIILPLLVIVAFLAFRGSVTARLIWIGTLVYLLYDFLGYALAIHLSPMLLVYCGILGLSFCALAGSLSSLPVQEIATRQGQRAPVRTAAIVLLLMSVGTVFHWLEEYAPAMLAGRTPQALLDSGLVSEPVAVLDLAFGAPACAIAAILLLRRRPMGFVFGPVFLTYLVLSGLVLAPMGIAMFSRGLTGGTALIAIGLGIAAGCGVLLALLLRRKGSEWPHTNGRLRDRPRPLWRAEK